MSGGGATASVPPSLRHHSHCGMDNLAELADWGQRQRQRKRQEEATRVAAAKAMQSEPTVGSGLGEKVRVVGAEEGEEVDLPPVLHKAWAAPRLRP